MSSEAERLGDSEVGFSFLRFKIRCFASKLFLKKFFEIFWRMKKSSYLCNPVSKESGKERREALKEIVL